MTVDDRRSRTASMVAALGVVATTGALIAVSVAGSAPASATGLKAPAFGTVRYVAPAGKATRIGFRVESARRCTIRVTSPAGKSKSFVTGFTAGSSVADFVVAPRKTTSPGHWRLAATCSASGHALRTAKTVVQVTGSKGKGFLVGADSNTHLDVAVTAVKVPKGAGNGSGGTAYPANPFDPGQCTYWAYQERPDVYALSIPPSGTAPRSGWNGGAWGTYAKLGGFPEGSTPVVGALVSIPSAVAGGYGHVAYVSQVFDAQHFLTTEMNTLNDNDPSLTVYTVFNYVGTPGPNAVPFATKFIRPLRAGAVFIYGGPAGDGPGSGSGTPTPTPPTTAPAPPTTAPAPPTTAPAPPTTAPAPPPPPPPAPSISASKGGPYDGGYTLDIAVHNFPTGTFEYYCHDNSGPGGSDTVYFQHAVTVTDPNQSSWPGVFCYDSGGYVAYLTMDGYQSNGVQY